MTSQLQTQSKPSIFKRLGALAAIGLLAVGAYSIYVATHEPDSQETVLLGQTRVAAGSPAGFRIVVRNRITGQTVRGANVEIALASKNSQRTRLGNVHTDASGTFDGSLNIPEVAPGNYQLLVDVTSSLGRDHLVKNIEVENPARVFLSSDKPLYQPGQTIHLRTMLVNPRTEKPLTNETMTFEISDPNGNKVFKETRLPSTFGIAAADFVLASELNPGRYQIRAAAGPATAERAVEVKHYVLPKFKIRVSTDKPYYLPGQIVTGTVEGNYFFGKPVAEADVNLTAATVEDKPVAIAGLKGTTDSNGKYAFRFVLPDFFAGLPEKNAQAFLDLTATLTDTARHSEKSTLSLTVAQSELEIAAIPEAGTFVPGVENVLYVLTSYPDGRPAACKVLLNGTAYATDAAGVCEIKLTPSDTTPPVELTALDSVGRKAKLVFHPDKTLPAAPLLVRADKAVYQAGQAAKITVLSSEGDNTVFIDAIKDGQTVFTKSASLKNHAAECAIDLPASLVGPLQINAYVIAANGEDRGSSRVLFINPASGLNISAKLSKPIYRPGELATVDLSVTDSRGQPAPAALGIAAVDESVFALHENRPGLLQQFLDAESDLLKPRYQIKFFDTPDQILLGTQQRLASAYLASLEQRSAPSGIEAMIHSGDPSAQSLVDQLRRFKGTKEYESLRNDPQFAEAFRFAEGGGGLYTMREATGPVKLQATEAHRRAYFNALGKYGRNAFLAAVFLAPLILLICLSRRKSAVISANASPGALRGAEISVRVYNKLGAATIFPLIWYPGGLALFAGRNDHAAWFLFGVEVVAILLLLCVGFFETRPTAVKDLGRDTTSARIGLIAFFTQFAFSRASFAMIALNPPSSEDMLIMLLLGSVLAPLTVLASYGILLKNQMDSQNITTRTPQVSFAFWASVIVMILVLSSMLLPSLARAKQKAQRISLINTLRQIETEKQIMDSDNAGPENAAQSSPRIRRDFPETLFWRPELITDDHGKASLEIPLADSITTWRTAIDGISSTGKMGGAELPIPVFQDFFIDLDLPVSMSLGDEVSVPISCYNYLNEAQDVHLTLASADWFESPLRTAAIHLAPNEVKSATLPIKVVRVGNRSLRISAQGTKMSDAVEREIRVLPVGEKTERTQNEILQSDFTDTMTIPEGSVPDSQKLIAKFYPSRFSEIVEGLDSIFEAPHGCFEQTSSTTYPNVLVLDYLKRMGRLTPEIEIRARKFINTGYQRLLTFEVPGGGFEWFGHTPANVGLTAYGILEFTDMNHIQPVDQAMVSRTLEWLRAQQSADGSWKQADGYDDWSQRKPLTAYVAWSLAEAGDHSPTLQKALDYLRTHPDEISTTYAKALAANALLGNNRSDAFGRQLATQLHDTAFNDCKQMVHWKSTGQSLTHSIGMGMETETTALAAMALMKAGMWPQTVKQALNWISKAKDANGTFGSTQATILAIRALLTGSTTSLGQDFESVISVKVNGQSVETFHVTKDNSDVMKQVDLTKFLRLGENKISFHQEPAGELPFQFAGSYWKPSVPTISAAKTNADPLQIDVQYDRTALSINDQLKCSVTVKNNTSQRINMAIVDLGIPPGFEVDETSFERMREKDQIAKFELTGAQVILYLRDLSESSPFKFDYSLRAKYPLRVQTPPSAVYEYYQPKNRAEAKRVTLEAL